MNLFSHAPVVHPRFWLKSEYMRYVMSADGKMIQCSAIILIIQEELMILA